MKMLLLTAIGGALLAAPAAAQQSPYAGRTAAVHYADLDLGTDAGRAALDRRLGAAAREACGTASSADPRGQNEVRRCRAETLASLAAERDRIVGRAQDTQLAAQ